MREEKKYPSRYDGRPLTLSELSWENYLAGVGGERLPEGAIVVRGHKDGEYVNVATGEQVPIENVRRYWETYRAPANWVPSLGGEAGGAARDDRVGAKADAVVRVGETIREWIARLEAEFAECRLESELGYGGDDSRQGAVHPSPWWLSNCRYCTHGEMVDINGSSEYQDPWTLDQPELYDIALGRGVTRREVEDYIRFIHTYPAHVAAVAGFDTLLLSDDTPAPETRIEWLVMPVMDGVDGVRSGDGASGLVSYEYKPIATWVTTWVDNGDGDPVQAVTDPAKLSVHYGEWEYIVKDLCTPPGL